MDMIMLYLSQPDVWKFVILPAFAGGLMWFAYPKLYKYRKAIQNIGSCAWKSSFGAFLLSSIISAALVAIPCALDLAHWMMVAILSPTAGLMFAVCAAEREWKTEPRDR